MPQQLFEDQNTVALRLPYSENNKKCVKSFMKKLNDFTNKKMQV